MMPIREYSREVFAHLANITTEDSAMLIEIEQAKDGSIEGEIKLQVIDFHLAHLLVPDAMIMLRALNIAEVSALQAAKYINALTTIVSQKEDNKSS